MSSVATDNAALVRGAYEDFGRGDIPAVLGFLADDVVWTESAGGLYGGTYEGPQAVLEGIFARVGAEWDGFVVDLERVLADGDAVVGVVTYRGTYRATGRSVVARGAHVWEVRDGRAIRVEQFTDTAQFAAVVS
ncbi:nuclear transport factor 2 family protein [Actinomycetospora aeridis]|uniref:Nuclear transport factor 2 family protein n=1 Tax=Actinomycetospora aeridis TaxID=3129231 RepID=A0ABU8NB34_9PSEU